MEIVFSRAAGIFAEKHIDGPMRIVFNRPVGADHFAEVQGITVSTGNVIMVLKLGNNE